MRKLIVIALVLTSAVCTVAQQDNNVSDEEVVKVSTQMVRVPILAENETKPLKFLARVNSNPVKIEKVSRPKEDKLKSIVINLSSPKTDDGNFLSQFNSIFQNLDLLKPTWIDAGEINSCVGESRSKWECKTAADVDDALAQAEAVFTASRVERQSLLIISDNSASLDGSIWDKINPRLPSMGRAVSIITKRIPQKAEARKNFAIYRSNLRGANITISTNLSEKEYLAVQIKSWLNTIKNLYLVSFYMPNEVPQFEATVEAYSKDDTIAGNQTRLINQTETQIKSEVDEAFSNFDFKKLVITAVKFDQETVKHLKSNFLPEVKPLVLEKGDECDRLEKLAKSVFLLHGVNVQTVVIKSNLPTVFTWKETFITFSTKALDTLTDDEVTALLAHEVGHLYFNDKLQIARDAGNSRLSRIIELKCDLVALETLKRLGIPVKSLTNAVDKLIDARNEIGVESNQPESPSMKNRIELVARFSTAR